MVLCGVWYGRQGSLPCSHMWAVGDHIKVPLPSVWLTYSRRAFCWPLLTVPLCPGPVEAYTHMQGALGLTGNALLQCSPCTDPPCMLWILPRLGAVVTCCGLHVEHSPRHSYSLGYVGWRQCTQQYHGQHRLFPTHIVLSLCCFTCELSRFCGCRWPVLRSVPAEGG
jgi:hypothetical protein